MKKIIVASLMASVWIGGCSSLPKEQRLYEAAYQVIHAIDAAQTLNIRKKEGNYETNPILGERPKDAEVIAYMAAESALHYAVTYQLAEKGAPMWVQHAWHCISIGWNGKVIISNHKRGL